MNIHDLVFQTVFWALGFLFLFRIPHCRNRNWKKDAYPSTSVIIPARNEEKSLPILLRSLREQSFRPYEIIVVDGTSEDRTFEIARREGAIVMPSGPLPAGWLGKPWACCQGASVAKGDLLIFLDADTFMEKDGLKQIIDTYLARDGVVTVQPFHQTKQLYEQLSGYFNIIELAGMGTFTALGNLIKPIGLFGPCVIMSRKYYFKSGGHRQVKGEVVEDLALGSRIKKQKVPIHCYGGRGTLSFRMYPNGLGELVEGWGKGFATGALKTPLPLLAALILWIGGSITATSHVIQSLSGANTAAVLIWGTTYLLYAAQIYWMLARAGTFKFYTALLYPVSLLFFLVVFIRSFFLIYIRKSVNWKGQKISLKNRVLSK